MKLPSPDWSVYSRYVNNILQAGDYLGAPVDALLVKAGIEKNRLKDGEQRIPVGKVLDFYQSVAAYSNTPDLGLYTGRIAHAYALNLQLYMSSVCTNYRSFLKLIPSLLQFAGDLGEVVVQTENDLICLEWHPLWQVTCSDRLLSDEILSLSAAFGYSVCILPVPIRRAHFTYSEPKDLTLLREFFCDDLSFDQPVSCFYFDRESLDYPVLRYGGRLTETSSREMTDLLGQERHLDPFLRKLYEMIFRRLPEGEIGVDEVARGLNLSRRTLQRRLSDRGTSFLEMLQEVRATQALRYMTDRKLSVMEIAFLLGYQDPDAFAKAFKSWHGVSPRDFRRSLSRR